MVWFIYLIYKTVCLLGKQLRWVPQTQFPWPTSHGLSRALACRFGVSHWKRASPRNSRQWLFSDFWVNLVKTPWASGGFFFSNCDESRGVVSIFNNNPLEKRCFLQSWIRFVKSSKSWEKCSVTPIWEFLGVSPIWEFLCSPGLQYMFLKLDSLKGGEQLCTLRWPLEEANADLGPWFVGMVD